MVLLPALVASGHSGTVHPRTAPELSDIALFAVAVVAVWLVRRAMRRRFAKKD
jgi:membrane protein implicated in regulation of membrane protease activity